MPTNDPYAAYQVPIRWLTVYNADSEAAPAHGVLEVVGVDTTGAFIVSRPTGDSLLNFLVAGPGAIPSEGYGQAVAVQSGPTIVACDIDPATGDYPEHGEEWGTETGEWALQAGQTGCLILGDAEEGLCNVQLTLAGDPGGGGSGVNLEESDGTPAYPSAATIFVNRTTGVGLNASTATIEGVPATATQQGVVTTGTQTFDGTKTFSGGIVTSNITASGTGQFAAVVITDGVGGGQLTPTATLFGQEWLFAGNVYGGILLAPDSGTISQAALVGYGGLVPSWAIVNSGGTKLVGAWGTLVDGSAVSGGLITTIGSSGGYTDEQSQDSVGNILVDSSTIDFAYNDGVPSITASVIDDSITYAKMQEVAARRLLGNPSGSTANPSEIPLGLGLEFRSSNLATFLGLDSEEWTAAGDSTATITSTWATLTDDAGDPVEIQLPAAGTYLLTAHLSASLHISSGSDAWIAARLYDSDDSVTVANSETTIVRTKQTTSEVFGTATIHAPHTASDANTVVVQVKLDGVGLLAVTVGKIRSHADGRARIAHWRQT
jgi:hypothetical protein